MTNFLAALQAKSAAIAPAKPTPTPTPTPTPPPPVITEEPVITVTVNAARNRLDLEFSSKPSAEIRESLRLAGWQWLNTQGCWYHFDCEVNRCFARQLAGLSLEELPRLKSEAEEAEEMEETAPVEATAFEPIFSAYRQQVNEILEYTGLTAADLQLVAVDCLYSRVFGAGPVVDSEQVAAWRSKFNFV